MVADSNSANNKRVIETVEKKSMFRLILNYLIKAGSILPHRNRGEEVMQVKCPYDGSELERVPLDTEFFRVAGSILMVPRDKEPQKWIRGCKICPFCETERQTTKGGF